MAKEFPRVEEILSRVFDQIGARPEPIFIPAILLEKGGELGLYVSPQLFGNLYGSEEAAQRDLGEKDTLYHVTVKRVR